LNLSNSEEENDSHSPEVNTPKRGKK
jgi:hypothetical protein